MLEVKFYEEVEDRLLKFAVIVARSKNQWVFCKHKERDTYEVPGGHREQGENIVDTAKRELQEETGALDFELTPVCIYCVKNVDTAGNEQEESYGLLCYAEIYKFGPLPNFEMEQVYLAEEMPTKWTYPLIQPRLMERINELLEL